jgi:hypothetical protein
LIPQNSWLYKRSEGAISPFEAFGGALILVTLPLEAYFPHAVSSLHIATKSFGKYQVVFAAWLPFGNSITFWFLLTRYKFFKYSSYE